MTGRTRSDDFAGRNNSHHGGDWDSIALQVSPTDQLQWMTYLGGSGDDFGYGIALDSAGHALVTGWTKSSDFSGRNNSQHGSREYALILKLRLDTCYPDWDGDGQLDVLDFLCFQNEFLAGCP